MLDSVSHFLGSFSMRIWCLIQALNIPTLVYFFFLFKFCVGGLHLLPYLLITVTPEPNHAGSQCVPCELTKQSLIQKELTGKQVGI